MPVHLAISCAGVEEVLDNIGRLATDLERFRKHGEGMSEAKHSGVTDLRRNIWKKDVMRLCHGRFLYGPVHLAFNFLHPCVFQMSLGDNHTQSPV